MARLHRGSHSFLGLITTSKHEDYRSRSSPRSHTLAAL